MPKSYCVDRNLAGGTCGYLLYGNGCRHGSDCFVCPFEDDCHATYNDMLGFMAYKVKRKLSGSPLIGGIICLGGFVNNDVFQSALDELDKTFPVGVLEQ